MIEKSSIESLKTTLDIVDVIGSYIQLKKSGTNYKANCPFHGEKTPSFVVSSTKQIYHCFGCGVGGDAIKFVMEIEKLSYPEAVEKLASMTNFTLHYTQGNTDHSDTKRILEQCQKWYIKNIDQNPTAMAYLLGRGISHASIEKFGIGFAPSGNIVMGFLRQSLLPLPQALESGVIAKNERDEFYPRLVDRITFPIYGSLGSLVGFGGRTITNHPAKYINSPQTKLFNKSRLLYGYHLAKEKIYKTKQIIICEGYLDVVMLHQAGITEAVATMGTALTTDHLPLLKKGEPRIVLAYDGDKAGVTAALKAAQLLIAEGFDGGVVLFPDNMDPADLIASGESQKVMRLLREVKMLIPFVLEKQCDAYDLSNPRQKEIAFGEIKQFLSSLSPIMQEAYLPIASTLLGVSVKIFGFRNSQTKPSIQSVTPKDDVLILSLLKTLIEFPQRIDLVLDVLESEILGNYAELFSTIVHGKTEESNVIALSMDERYHAMEETEFKESLLRLLEVYYTQKSRTIHKDPNLSYAQKFHIKRKIQLDILPRLKRGEFVKPEL